MSKNTKWDINKYKTDFESDEQWILRKKFMETHKNKFPEDKLVCLAQVFINVEFLGCKYPDKTMQRVACLSEDIAKEYRNESSNRLKRTFVKASDAAEARAKGNSMNKCLNNNISSETKQQTVKQTGIRNAILNQFINNHICQQQKTTNLLPNPVKEFPLFDNLDYGNFVLWLVGSNNAIRISGQRSGVKIEEIESNEDDQIAIEILVGGKIAGRGLGPITKIAKQTAFSNAIANLQEKCYTIKNKPHPQRIDVEKNNQTVVCSLKKTYSENKIDSNNIGYKIMQKIGWKGGQLGKDSRDAIEYPIDFFVKNNRKGLGSANSDINAGYFKKLLDKYIKSEDIRDLHFVSSFTKNERATLHSIASSKGLKSSSYGKEPDRHLVISKKHITPSKIVNEVLIKKNPMYINKFSVKVPKKKINDFPDNAEFEDEESEEEDDVLEQSKNFFSV